MNWLLHPHPGGPLAPHDLWASWDAAPLLPLGLAVLLYGWGVYRVWRRAGAGRGIPFRRALCFLGAMLALALALVSPLDALSGVLFSAHMAQHLILMLVAAPLLVLSELPLALLWALPRRWAQALGQGLNQSKVLLPAWRTLSSPVSAWLLFAVGLWAWHAPAFFEAALEHEAIHALEHLIFLGTSILFWRVLITSGGPAYLRYAVAVPYLFTTALHSGILGALMTFTTQPWYPYYAPLVALWGLTPLQDQQLAGLVMWIPGGAVFTLLTIGYFGAWLRAVEQRSLQLP